MDDISKLRDVDFKDKHVLICGKPTSGKTTLAVELAARTGLDIIHTDDYMDIPFKMVPYKVIQDAKKYKQCIIEGIQAPRVLKYGRMYGYKPDIIIHLDNTEETDPKHKGLATLNSLERVKALAHNGDLLSFVNHFIKGE